MDRALRSLSELPPFSAILNRLMASLAGDNVSFAKLGDLIEKDTVVAGNILNLVNSSLYARSGTVNSVRRAISLLGVNKLRNAVLGMSISRVWSKVHTPKAWSMARFNMHSASVAILSDQLAQCLPVTYPEGAFVAGLFHDVGRLLIALALPDEFGRILQTYDAGGVSLLECEQTWLGFNHAALSAEALALWNLPESIQKAVRDHHDPVHAGPNGAGEIPLSQVVDAANQYVNSTGESILLKKPEDAADPAVIESLGLPPERLQALLAEFQAESEAMAKFFC
jgi:HD-like signal output (HDOD) protein